MANGGFLGASGVICALDNPKFFIPENQDWMPFGEFDVPMYLKTFTMRSFRLQVCFGFFFVRGFRQCF